MQPRQFDDSEIEEIEKRSSLGYLNIQDASSLLIDESDYNDNNHNNNDNDLDVDSTSEELLHRSRRLELGGLRDVIQSEQNLSPRSRNLARALQGKVYKFNAVAVTPSIELSPVERGLVEYINARALMKGVHEVPWVTVKTHQQAEELADIFNNKLEEYQCKEVMVHFPPPDDSSRADQKIQIQCNNLHEFFSGLSGQLYLTSLILNTEVGPKAGMFIASYVIRTQSLKVLSLTDCGLAEGIILICEAMLHNTSVTDLNFSSNRIGGPNMIQVISFTLLGHHLRIFLFKALARMIRKDNELVGLILTGNKIDENGLVELLIALDDREKKLVDSGTPLSEANAFFLDVSENPIVADETALLAITLLKNTKCIGAPECQASFGKIFFLLFFERAL